jgi:hypothetical protein
MNNFNEEFHNDWGLPEESTNLKKNKNINKPSSIENNEWGNSENEYINTFLGKFPKNIPEYELGTEQNKEMQKEMLNSAAFSPGIKLLSGGLSKLPEMAKTLLTKSEQKK